MLQKWPNSFPLDRSRRDLRREYIIMSDGNAIKDDTGDGIIKIPQGPGPYGPDFA